MTIAYFDCFSGVAGDMVLGAVLDLGVKSSFLQQQLKKLSLSGYTIKVKTVKINNIGATDVAVEVSEKQHHRHLSDILGIINQSSLSSDVKKLSSEVFINLAKAEAKVHRIPVEQVHFHEVGAVDSIIDIVGSVIGITHLGIQRVYCSPLPLGTGFVTCAHGILPLPAPATVELLANIPVYSVDRTQELVTPTGAALMKTLVHRFGEMPAMTIHKIGYGAGKIQSRHPSMLRVYIGEQQKSPKKNK